MHILLYNKDVTINLNFCWLFVVFLAIHLFSNLQLLPAWVKDTHATVKIHAELLGSKPTACGLNWKLWHLKIISAFTIPWACLYYFLLVQLILSFSDNFYRQCYYLRYEAALNENHKYLFGWIYSENVKRNYHFSQRPHCAR